jgi:hypothetical protein
MHSPRPSTAAEPSPENAGAEPAADEAEVPGTVPTVPAPPLGDDEWDPTVDPMEGLDPATTWWGG